MELAHDSVLGRHMGSKKTEDRILSNFFWPGMHQDVTSYEVLCCCCFFLAASGSSLRFCRTVPTNTIILNYHADAEQHQDL